jgi:hypothetical protein
MLNQTTVKKIISPLIYPTVTLVSCVVTFFALTFFTTIHDAVTYDKQIHNDGVSWTTRTDIFSVSIGHVISVSFFIVPIVILLLGSIWMRRFEKLEKPHIGDHLRQSLLLYAYVIYAEFLIAQFERNNVGEEWGASRGVFFLNIMAKAGIVINAIYLLFHYLYGTKIKKVGDK